MPDDQQSGGAALPPRGSEGPGGASAPKKPKEQPPPKAKPKTPEVWPGADKPQGANAATKRKSPDKPGGTGRDYFGLESKSELLYPTAYAPVSAEFWQGLSTEQQQEITRLQAIAQEKVGFEKSAPKYFIEDFRPGEQGTRAAQMEADLVSITAPRFVLGGALMGSGGLSMLLAATGYLPLGPVGASGAVAFVIGLVLCLNARS